MNIKVSPRVLKGKATHSNAEPPTEPPPFGASEIELISPYIYSFSFYLKKPQQSVSTVCFNSLFQQSVSSIQQSVSPDDSYTDETDCCGFLR